MMIFWAGVFLVLVVLFIYLKTKVSSEKSFTMTSGLSRQVIFDFLKTPSNLERIHPRIQKVSDVKTEDSDFTFQIEEHLGPVIGKRTFPMRLCSFSDVSHLTSRIRLESNSFIAQVTVTLAISDYDPESHPSGVNETESTALPTSTIHGCITVRAVRVVNFLISGILLRVWDKTLRTTLDLLSEDSDKSNHEKIS